MCLSEINKEKPKPNGVGYKVFEKDSKGKLRSWLYGPDPTKGKWMKARKEYQHHRNYWSGFHIFTTLDGAMKWLGVGPGDVIVKVRYRGAHTSGRQGSSPVVVADKMFVPKNCRNLSRNLMIKVRK